MFPKNLEHPNAYVLCTVDIRIFLQNSMYNVRRVKPKYVVRISPS